MASVFDVAAYILAKKGAVTTWKLQKLVYYSQAWSLVWDDKPLFEEDIEAWTNGPVCRVLYEEFQGQFTIREIKRGNPGILSAIEQETVDAVVRDYGGKSPQWLSDLTRLEDPWLHAREGIPKGVRGCAVISRESMAEYYESLSEEDVLEEGDYDYSY